MLKITGKINQDNAALICIAGNLCSPQVFDQIQAPEGMQKLYLDYLQSPGPWDMDFLGAELVNTIQNMSFPKTFLAGYSAGGVLAISAACKAPDLFAGLLLSNTGPCSIGHGNPGFAQELKDRFEDEEYIRTFLRSCFYHPITPEMENQLFAYTRTVSPQAAFEVSDSLRRVDYRNALSRYKNPVMIAHGRLDTRRKLDSVAMLQECLPQAEIMLLETGHTPMMEDPAGYQDALNRLVRRCGTGSV